MEWRSSGVRFAAADWTFVPCAKPPVALVGEEADWLGPRLALGAFRGVFASGGSVRRRRAFAAFVVRAFLASFVEHVGAVCAAVV